jgi:methyl-accepting chemotaxis protein
MKIGKKLVIMIIALTLSGIGILLGTILDNSRKQIALLVNSEMRNLANYEASQLGLWLESPFSVARSLAQAMEGYGEVAVRERRHFYNLLLKQITEANPGLATVWTIWEPNALDGLDAEYANTHGTDASGRFISSWTMTSAGARAEAAVGYEDPNADFYFLALRSGVETVTEPFFYPINGVDTLITSLVVPIKRNGRAIGVAGVDIPLSGIQSEIEKIAPYEGSIAAAFTNQGMVAGHFDISRLGKSMRVTEVDVVGSHIDELEQAVQAGTPYMFSSALDNKGTKIPITIFTSPFSIGNTTTPWALALGVPQRVIAAPVLKMLRLSLVISATMLVIIAAAAFLIARSISTPVRQMVKVVTGLGEGDLTGCLDIRSRDEIGDMARVFNGTMEKIKNLILTIKNRPFPCSTSAMNLPAT